ncbi:MAG: NAD+ synthase [Actinomycetota bacterium]|nr:NAD+ synthase [Actinomycetota bacterium]
MVRMALGQINPVVGDIGGNTDRILDVLERARDGGAQVVAVPELAVTGYPPEDLVFKVNFVEANRKAVDKVAAATEDELAIVGFVDAGHDRLYNAAALCHSGQVLAVYRKHLLPNYGVFDEQRYFEPGRGHTLLETQFGVIGVCVCEDIWFTTGPAISQGDNGAQVVVNINASPFNKAKLQERTKMLSERARRAKASIVYVNTVGGQDELVFDGSSLVIDAEGDTVARLPQFKEEVAIIDVPLGEAGPTTHPEVRRIPIELGDGGREPTPATVADPLGDAEEIYEALKLGLRDYVRKNRFQKVVVGLSGGIDSALTAVIATDALGPDQVLGVAMPSEYSTSHSIEDAKQLAANLDIELREIHIADSVNAYGKALESAFGKAEPGLAEENLQARIRGNLLMAISNRYGHLVVATGNKSEMACGYATLYGDMAGGFALLKDVFKTEVYELARYRNTISPVIPERVLTKPPSAELRPNQKDSDSLPPYDQLDPILEAYIEQVASVSQIAEAGHDRETVKRVVELVDRAEYKRRQAPPGPKVTVRAFGRDRRLPITNAWRDLGEAEFPAKVTGEKRPGP